jgi:hypothetical protein
VASRRSRESRIAKRTHEFHVTLFICLLVLFGLPLGGTSARSHNSKPFGAGGGLPSTIGTFAIGDFDGDLAPDIATLESVSNSSGTNYLVQLQFGSGQRRSVPLSAPRGYLQIVARDVNGDRIPDLIIGSAWTEQPHAVLINDGNGAFSPVDPSSVQALSPKSEQSLSWPQPQLSETAATSPPPAEGGFATTKRMWHTCPRKRLVHRPNSVLFRCPLLVSLPSHAPPGAAFL